MKLQDTGQRQQREELVKELAASCEKISRLKTAP